MEEGERRVRSTVDRLLTAVLACDAQAAADVFAPGGVYMEAGRPPIEGRAAIEAYFAAFFGRATKWTFDVDAMIVEGPRAAVAYRFGSTGDLGRRTERHGCAIVETSDGCILRWREYEG